jgi:branched-chain amino acid transport system substrate-binding protein
VTALGLALLLAGAVIPRASGWAGSEGSAVSAPAQSPTGQPPYKKPLEVPLDYRGPGREEPEPDVREVVLAWFGPGDPDQTEFGDFWRGAALALDRENAAGGYRGKPFRLQAVWSENPWQAGITDLTRLVVGGGAWAVLGGLDGTTTHLAVQTAFKAHVLLLSPGSTDATTDHANVPWLFSLAPSDEAIAPVLAGWIAASAAPFAVAAATDHDSHATLVALRRALAARRLGPAALVEVATEDSDLPGAVAQLLGSRPATLVVVARPLLAARLVSTVRQEGFSGQVVGGPGLSRAAFTRAAGAAADGVVAPLLVDPAKAAGPFVSAYEARWQAIPDAAAALGYDSVWLAAEAVRRAGLNRARIRDAVRALATWSGASGAVAWSPLGRNDRAVALGRWHDGRLVAAGR